MFWLLIAIGYLCFGLLMIAAAISFRHDFGFQRDLGLAVLEWSDDWRHRVRSIFGVTGILGLWPAAMISWLFFNAIRARHLRQHGLVPVLYHEKTVVVSCQKLPDTTVLAEHAAQGGAIGLLNPGSVIVDGQEYEFLVGIWRRYANDYIRRNTPNLEQPD